MLARARTMGDFLVGMQLRSGGFRAHTPAQKAESDPRVFNTGQDIIGLVDLYKYTKKVKYLKSASAAGDFLCSIQESDGKWVKFTYGDKAHTYHTRCALALIKLHKETKNRKFLMTICDSQSTCLRYVGLDTGFSLV